MRKAVIVIIMLFAIFLFGCSQFGNNSPFITPLSPKEVIRPVTSSYLVEFYVSNPTTNTISANITYKYDKCLTTDGGDKQPVQLPQNDRLAYSKEFYHVKLDQYGRPYNSIRSECLQKPLKISVELRDAGGDLRSTADFVVTLTSTQ